MPNVGLEDYLKKKTCEPQTGALLLCKVYEKSGLSNVHWSKLKLGLAKSDCFSFLHWRVIALPIAELVLRGSGLVPDFRVFQFDAATNLSIFSTNHNFLETQTFLGNTDISPDYPSHDFLERTCALCGGARGG